jgi:hypothetical protein
MSATAAPLLRLLLHQQQLGSEFALKGIRRHDFLPVSNGGSPRAKRRRKVRGRGFDGDRAPQLSEPESEGLKHFLEPSMPVSSRPAGRYGTVTLEKRTRLALRGFRLSSTGLGVHDHSSRVPPLRIYGCRLHAVSDGKAVEDCFDDAANQFKRSRRA